ncbi:GGDEF domain-containing protein [Paenochrobactrum pullorum]|uniref:GGDEF domain-containing protein n=1 Tax=Paenochrobactrum pullorum TaxID=1324351 RepID=UPI0035BBC26A
MQMLWIPPSSGPNALITAFIYALSVLMLCDGLLKRNGEFLTKRFYVIVLTLIVSGIAYFFYADRNLLIRIYILNFGFGIVFLYTLWRLNKFQLKTVPDRFLFWLLFAFALQFFIRTGLTITGISLIDPNIGSSIFWLALQYSLAVFGVSLALALLAVVVHDKLVFLKNESVLDPLTGLQNRRGFDDQAGAIIENRHDREVAVLLIDIDHFKSINDTFGHACGDDVLREVGSILKGFAHPGDIYARIGGEEFIILICDRNLIEAKEWAEQICTLIEAHNFKMMPNRRKVTVSIGVASAHENENLYGLISRADRCLYAAKNAGRNRVVIDHNDADIDRDLIAEAKVILNRQH